MTRKYYFYQSVQNQYLNVSKEIKGATRAEVYNKVQEQLRKWDEQEKKQRERDRIVDLKSKAEFDTENASSMIKQYENILKATLRVNDKIQWSSLRETETFSEAFPTLQRAQLDLNVPKANKLIELFISSSRVKREKKEEEAVQLFNQRVRAYEESKKDFEERQAMHNEGIDQFKADFEQGHGEAIEKYIYMVLEKSQYPLGFEQDYELKYDPISGTVIVNYNLPSKESVPNVVSYKYVASRKAIDAVEFKLKEFNIFYENVLYQICLRTIHEIFESVYVSDVKSVVFNGWIDGIDSKTGNDFRSCILSCQAPRSEFESYNLDRVDPKECFRNLKGLSAGPLAQLAPVRPIMDINTEDRRFVESQNVLGSIDGSTNLAEMDWESFEHLVRELFANVFSKDGSQVRVTQASRDGGVDAVAFDPDPIRGGKFVIQAKRYNNVVPVSAVRDLYGTMVSEGATKGILVTTSYYGNDSREFAKDKPLTLIDGSNLIYMFQEYGHKVHIQLRR